MPQCSREPRKTVRIGVRLKDDAGWSDAQILNVSSRGVMALCQDPPRRGSYVEVRRGTYIMIGRVAWTGTDRIGVHVRERIDIENLRLPVTPGRKAPRPVGEMQMRVCEPRKPSVDERATASARFARAFDFAAIAIIAVGLAVLASGTGAEAFGSSMAQVERALIGNTP
jgi:hypothetical protein